MVTSHLQACHLHFYPLLCKCSLPRWYLLLTDLSMPSGTAGHELGCAVTQHPETPRSPHQPGLQEGEHFSGTLTGTWGTFLPIP